MASLITTPGSATCLFRPANQAPAKRFTRWRSLPERLLIIDARKAKHEILQIIHNLAIVNAYAEHILPTVQQSIS